MVPDHQVRRKWSGDASKKVQLFKVGGSRIIGTSVLEGRVGSGHSTFSPTTDLAWSEFSQAD